MPFLVEEFVESHLSCVIANGDTLLDAIVAALGRLDTREIHELQTVYLPRARLQAVNSEARTPPVRLPEPTVAVPVAAIRRATRDAAAVVHDDDGAPD